MSRGWRHAVGAAHLINGAPPDPGSARPRSQAGRPTSQNMNFVVDLSVGEFVAMHADCRMTPNREAAAAEAIACANELAGEKFSAGVSLTQLSGGQTPRADDRRHRAAVGVSGSPDRRDRERRHRPQEIARPADRQGKDRARSPPTIRSWRCWATSESSSATVRWPTSSKPARREKANLAWLQRIDRGLWICATGSAAAKRSARFRLGSRVAEA